MQEGPAELFGSDGIEPPSLGVATERVTTTAPNPDCLFESSRRILCRVPSGLAMTEHRFQYRLLHFLPRLPTNIANAFLCQFEVATFNRLLLWMQSVHVPRIYLDSHGVIFHGHNARHFWHFAHRNTLSPPMFTSRQLRQPLLNGLCLCRQDHDFEIPPSSLPAVR